MLLTHGHREAPKYKWNDSNRMFNYSLTMIFRFFVHFSLFSFAFILFSHTEHSSPRESITLHTYIRICSIKAALLPYVMALSGSLLNFFLFFLKLKTLCYFQSGNGIQTAQTYVSIFVFVCCLLYDFRLLRLCQTIDGAKWIYKHQ